MLISYVSLFIVKKCNRFEDMIFVILYCIFLLNFITKIQGYDNSMYFADNYDEQQNCKNKTAIEILEKKGRCKQGKKGSLDNCKIRLSEVLRDKCSATKVLNVSKYLKVNFGQSQLWSKSLVRKFALNVTVHCEGAFTHWGYHLDVKINLPHEGQFVRK